MTAMVISSLCQNGKAPSFENRRCDDHGHDSAGGVKITSLRLHRRLAADEARELAQPREDALAGERLEAVLEPQHQTTALHHHRRLRQHAGSRGRDQIGDAQRRAQDAGAIEHARGGKLAQPRRQLVVDQADVAEEHGERDEGAAGMIERDEGAVGDDVERLLAAIVGMRAPADVGEEAGGVPQPPLLRGLVETRGRHERVGPGDELLAMGGRARAQEVELARRRDQRVLGALLGVEHGIEQPLAHAERGDHDVLRLGDAHQVLEHQRGIGEQRAASIGHHLDLREHFRVDAVHEVGELERLLGRQHVAVHHMQRISDLPHVQARERAPGAADGVEGAALAGGEQLGSGERVLDDLLRLLDGLRRDVL